MKPILYLFLLSFSLTVFSQKADITSAIIALDNQKDLESAKKWIDVASDKIESGANLKPKMLAKYYHYKGLIYLKLFQGLDASELGKYDFLNIASQSFLSDLTLEKSNFKKKSISQLNICAYLYQDGAYKDYENKDYTLALQKFSKVISINTSPAISKIDTFNMYNAALMAYQSNEYNISADWALKLIKIDPKDERFHIRLINAYSGMEDLALQLEAIKNARIAVPQSKDIIFEEVNYYLASGNNDLLLESLDNAVASDAENPILHLVLGNTYAQLSDVDKAESSFKQAILLDPEYFDAYNNLASLYLDKTIGLIEKKNALSYKQEKLFNTYKKQILALYNKALPHLESCLRINPTSISIISALKEIYYKLDNAKASVSMKKLSELPDEEKAAFVNDFFAQ